MFIKQKYYNYFTKTKSIFLGWLFYRSVAPALSRNSSTHIKVASNETLLIEHLLEGGML